MQTEISRFERHDVIRKLLALHSYSNQREVVRAVRKRGIRVTQASISRDFRELGVVKVSGAYRALKATTATSDESNTKPARRVVLQITAAGINLLVVRTQGGAAGIIAASLDKRNIAGVLGTVAGDDTVFVATADRAGQKRARAILEKLSSDWNL